MGHDGFNGGSQRVVAGFGGLVNGIDVWPISERDFATVGVADEFADDAVEDLFLVGH